MARTVAAVGGLEVKASGAAARPKGAPNARLANRLITPALRFAGENRLCRRRLGAIGTGPRAGRPFRLRTRAKVGIRGSPGSGLAEKQKKPSPRKTGPNTKPIVGKRKKRRKPRGAWNGAR
ncbi:hypothetical protein FACS189460_3390 [Deltaproteobacteria bacterium]|nr:hypothetical protein FACS189460_3390 [Deltaproteobacteria bacterium]